MQTIELECLAKFVILGKKHLDYLLTEFTAYYNEHRSHMERDHLPPLRTVPDELDTLDIKNVVTRTHVGGLVTSFERKAA